MAASGGGGGKHQLLPPSLRERYDLVSVRGKGNFAEVWEARHRRTGLKAAIKIISHAEMEAQNLSIQKVEREVSVMRLLRHHPDVIRFYEAVVAHGYSYIVMELADAGQLFDHVVMQGRLPEDQARAIFQQLAATVLYGSDRYIGPQVDVWSCGVILYGMLCGGLPFDGADNVILARNVRRGEYRMPSWVSDDARNLIAGMLIVRPQKRMTMAEVVAHRWLQPDTMPAYLAMPPPDARVMAAAVPMDEAAVEQLVTRHGYDRSQLLLQQQGKGSEDDAAVAYRLVLGSKTDASASRYLSLQETGPLPTAP